MRKLPVLFLAFVLYSCGLKDVIAPDLSGDVKCVYEVYRIGDGVNNKTIPSGENSINIELSPINKSNSSYIITLDSKGDSDTLEGIFEPKKAGDKIDLYEDGDKIGFINDNELDIDYNDGNGLRSIIKARK